jgi:hypothetical protein
VTLSDAFAAATGPWTGSNGFRMMPADPFSTRPSSATLTLAAGGSLLSFAYTWSHPEDGDHEGLLVAGPDDSGGLVALWADSWHQQPAPMQMMGTIDGDGALLVTGSYAGEWGWRIALAARGGDGLALRMDNVVPASVAGEAEAGPYPVMLAELGRPT